MLAETITGTASCRTTEIFTGSIFDVLGMEKTTPNFDKSHEHSIDVALPYMLIHGKNQLIQIPFYENPQASPAGSISSTLKDLVTWLKVHSDGGISNGTQFVSPFNLKQMHTPHMLIKSTVQQEYMFANNLFAYGLGWFIEPYRGVTLIHHGGNLDGFSLMGAFVPQEKLSIVVLTNIDKKGLRSALMYEALDRALGTEECKEWSQVYLKINEVTVQAAIGATETSKEQRIGNAHPTHTLKSYAGFYAAAGYTDIRIKWEDDILWALLFGKWWKFEHYHFDVFEIDISSRFQEKTKVTFNLDNHGAITSLSIPMEPSLDDIVFKRKPLEISTQVLETLVGRFEYPVLAQEVIVTLKEQTLSIALTGQAKRRLHCVEKAHGKLRFKLSGNEHSIVEFIASNETYEQLRILHSDATYECSRL